MVRPEDVLKVFFNFNMRIVFLSGRLLWKLVGKKFFLFKRSVNVVSVHYQQSVRSRHLLRPCDWKDIWLGFELRRTDDNNKMLQHQLIVMNMLVDLHSSWVSYDLKYLRDFFNEFIQTDKHQELENFEEFSQIVQSSITNWNDLMKEMEESSVDLGRVTHGMFSN